MFSAIYRTLLIASLTGLCPRLAEAGVDSVVTFNELHYHPAAVTDGEWIELKNQNSTDVDMSGWRLDGGVDFVFPAGTVIRGGRYLLIAQNPAQLMAQRGITGVLGPFSNTLNNAGETVSLKNNNSRRMDEITWMDSYPWPVAADGSGATLAKINEIRDTESPENWRASTLTGGTPGDFNFEATSYSGAAGQVAATGVPGEVKRYYNFDGDVLDSSGSNVTAIRAGGGLFDPDFAPAAISGQSLDFNGSSQSVSFADSFAATSYTISVWVKPDTIRAQSILLRTNTSGQASVYHHQLRMTANGRFEHYTNDGSARTVTSTTIAVAGQWYHLAGVARTNGQLRLYVNGSEEGTPAAIGSLFSTGTRWLVGSNSGGGMTYFDGRIDEVAVWQGPMDASQIGHLATGFRKPNEPALVNLALGRAVISGSGAWPDLAFDGGSGGVNDFSAQNVTDGSASDVTGSNYWLGRQGITPEHFILDLGSETVLSRILLRNTHHGAANDRGTAGFRLSAANEVDGLQQLVNPAVILEGTLGARPVLAPTPSNAPVPAESFTSANGLSAATARYLKFEAITGTDSANVGLNEIEVFGTPGANTATGPPTLVINEITAASASNPWLELLNYGSTAYPLSGCVLTTSRGAVYRLPSALLPAGGFLLVENSVSKLNPQADDKVFLYNDSGRGVLDAVEVSGPVHLLRPAAPSGGVPGAFLATLSPAEQSPGTVNRITLNTAVVINEIMYHHRPQFLPYQDNGLEWIELYNKSTAAVDLGGWRLDDAISWTFPAGTVIPPGGYLCVSNDATAFSAAHPGVPVTGNFSGVLSNRGEHVVLQDGLRNPVDEVFYRDKEPWPIYTDGLGSSIELRNPEADNAVPESWAASDESQRSQWKSFSYTATAKTPLYSPQIDSSVNFQELRMGLLEEGEVLVDDVSVKEITTTNTRELMQNGSFNAGTTAAWRLLGNHSTSGIFNDGGNPVLQLRASGPLLYMHNQLETTFKFGTAIVPVVNNRQYTVSLRAKWLKGCPWLHTQFYYNKLAKTFLLDLPAESGTPGARNSTWLENPGPTFAETLHAPPLPAVGQAVTVRSRVSDPQGLGSVALRYSVNGAVVFQSVPMTADADGFHRGTIPGQSGNAITQFYVEASDAAAVPATAAWPAAGPNSRALFRVNDGGSTPSKQNFRVITTNADATAIARPEDIMSNRRRGCTIIHNEQEIFYDSRIRLRGSMFSRGDLTTSGESITFPADKLFRGTQRTVSVRRGGIEEIVVKHAINAGGGLPDNYNDIIHLIGFRSDIRGPARMEMERFSNSWLDEFYPGGSDGTQFKMEGIRYPTQTFANGTIPAGNAEGIKNLTTNGIGWVGALDIADLGPDGEQYRHSFRWLNNFSKNDNARFVQMSRAMSLPVATAAQGIAFEAAIEPLMDVDEWMRCFAMMSLFGINDTYSQGNPHNLNFYMPPTPDGKISAIPWDWNFVFSLDPSAPLTGNGNIQKVINRPRFKRLFLGHLRNLMDTVFTPAYMTPWFNHYGAMAGASYSGYVSNLNTRRTTVTSLIRSQVPVVNFFISTNAGADFTTPATSAVLEGDGWVDVRDIRLNGASPALPVTWLDQNSWRVTVPVGLGNNLITLTAFDRRGVQVGTDSLTITNNSVPVPASPANTVISKIHYHPVTGGGDEFIEIMNISPLQFVELTGCQFSAGIAYTFPAGRIMAPGERLILTGGAFLNGSALSNGGERLTLEGPGGLILKNFVYDDAPPWPSAADGDGPCLVLIAPLTNPDPANPANWRLSRLSGGNPGVDDAIRFTGDPAGDQNGNGWSNLLEYALGPNPVPTAAAGLYTIPRVPYTDDAEVRGEVSLNLTDWTPAELVSSTPTSQTWRTPQDIRAGKTRFFRARVQLRQP